MRHLIGFILGIALGAALFLGVGWGFTHLATFSAQGTGLTSTTGLIAWSALAATGLLLGIVIAVRAISPLAPGLPGLGVDDDSEGPVTELLSAPPAVHAGGPADLSEPR